MILAESFLNFRYRRVWSTPERKIRTLEGFAQTETDAGESILNTLPFVDDEILKKHMNRHAIDELRHGKLFKNRAEELKKLHSNYVSISSLPDKLYKLPMNKSSNYLDSHGFFSGESFKKHGKIMYIAMINIAEKKAEKLFNRHYNLLKNDAKTQEIFKQILKDERYHVSYTNKLLDDWKQSEKKIQVENALSFAKKVRFINTVSRKFSKFGERIGHFLLLVFYFTVVIPFAIISKLNLKKKGWQKPTQKVFHKFSQY